MTTKLIAAALIVISGGLAAATAQARSCQTVTFTRYVKRCTYGHHAGRYCHLHPITTTRQICVNNPPKIRRVPTPNHGRFTRPRVAPPSAVRRFTAPRRNPGFTTRRFDTFRRRPSFTARRLTTPRRRF